ncbi:MAG: DUF2752 domain-containing protein [Planctomycetes bacterium]|nr:DUF2752 domain-containing protein [Planctomycetota bacterium]
MSMSTETAPANPPPPPDRARGRRAQVVLVLLASVVVPGAASILYAFPPAEYSFFPPCWFYWLTGLHCPGCGATRCVHSLLHGDLAQAFAWNPLFVLVSPLLIYVAVETYYIAWTGRRIKRRTPGWAVFLLVFVIVSYWVLRNIEIYPLTLLAPHRI